jgi:predicted nuclease of restriction endonuclease-like (RecB) superfamily
MGGKGIRKRGGGGPPADTYGEILDQAVKLLDDARRSAVRRVNAVMTATYWQLGKLIVEQEQRGAARAGYGEHLVERLAADLTRRFGRGFSERNLWLCRAFFSTWPILQTASAESPGEAIARRFRLPWSHYALLLSVDSPAARNFYEEEALRGGWTIRELRRQISTNFYDRVRASKDPAALLARSRASSTNAHASPEEEIRDVYLLEFLDLPDVPSESDLEQALIDDLQNFLLELGGDWTFWGRQKRICVDERWFKVDLVFFHRALHCMVLFELKTEEFRHEHVGQINFYLNYAREHWKRPEENPPIGVLLCAGQKSNVVKYSLMGIENTVLAASYLRELPSEAEWADHIAHARRLVEARKERP